MLRVSIGYSTAAGPMAKGDGGPACGAVGPMDRLDLADPLAEIEAADEMIVVNLDHRRTIVVHNASLGDWWIGLVIQAYSGIVAPMSEDFCLYVRPLLVKLRNGRDQSLRIR